MAKSEDKAKFFSYYESVQKYCKTEFKSKPFYENMCQVVKSSNLPENLEKFCGIMEGISAVLSNKKELCKNVLPALELLLEFTNESPHTVSAHWKDHVPQLEELKAYSVKHYWPFNSCEKCEKIRIIAVELEDRISKEANSDSKIFCHNCNKIMDSKFKLETCEHNICPNCITSLPVWKREFGNSKLTCPVGKCTASVSKEWLKLVLDEISSWTGELNKTPKTDGVNYNVNCPSCGSKVYQNLGDDLGVLFAECGVCAFLFCTNCFEQYHGVTECQSVNPVSSEKSPLSSSIGIPSEDLYGPFSTSYEQEFYAQQAGAGIVGNFTYEEMSDAFQCSDNLPSHNLPWESENYSANSYFPHPYQSLDPGKWVEDVIIEKSMQNFIAGENQSERVGVLESFFMPWSARKHDEDGEFARMIKKKKMLSKELFLVLINTEISGGGGHWILGVVNLANKSILILDSSFVSSNTYYQKFNFYLLHILHVAHALERNPFNPNEWELSVSLDCVQQTNASDCGPFVVANAFHFFVSGKQLSNRPLSGPLRSWILDLVKNRHGREKSSIHESDEMVSAMEIPAFRPSGLKICFKLLNR